MTFPYLYFWRCYLGMPACGGNRKGMSCRVLVRGSRNSALVEFEDGFKAVTSRNAIRKIR